MRMFPDCHWNLTPLALAKIGAIDDFFDLYTDIQKIYDTIKKTHTDPQTKFNCLMPDDWDKEANELVCQTAQPVLQKNIAVFTDENINFSATTFGFQTFTFLITHSSSSDPSSRRLVMQTRYLSFPDFLVQIQLAVAQILWHINTKITMNDTLTKIDRHIENYVQEHSQVRRFQVYNPQVTTPCSVLYIYKNLSSTGCRLQHHAVVARTCVIDLVSGDGKISIPVHYCKDCSKYFIGQTTLALFEKNYGKLLVRKQKIDDTNLAIELNLESVLHQFGYNVSDGRSEKERQQLLITLLNSHRVSYLEMVRCIEFNIQLHCNHPEAVMKWQRDLKYIGNYIIQQTS